MNTIPEQVPSKYGYFKLSMVSRLFKVEFDDSIIGHVTRSAFYLEDAIEDLERTIKLKREEAKIKKYQKHERR